MQDETFAKLERSLRLKFFFAGTNNESKYNERLYEPSAWQPPHWTYPSYNMNERLQAFKAWAKQQFKPLRGKPNLLPCQRRLLAKLLQMRHLVKIVPADKNIGVCAIERDKLIQMYMSDHLNNASNYKSLTPEAAERWSTVTKNRITQWIDKWKKAKKLDKSDRQSLQHKLKKNANPYGRFYGTLKVHKLTPENPQLKTRPIVSYSGNLLYGLAVWLDQQLQPIAQAVPSFIKNSYTLKQELLALNLPAGRTCQQAERTD